MAQWVSQAEVPSATRSALGRVAYLKPLERKVDSLIKKYFDARPDGLTVVPEVIGKVGRDTLRGLQGKRDLVTVVQDMGRFIAIRLVEIYRAPSVATYRENGGRAPSTRPWSGAPDWVKSYTPHRLRLRAGHERIVLDTNAVRDLLHDIENGKPLTLLEELASLKGRHAVSIADPSWAELVRFLLRSPTRFAAWSSLTKRLDAILDEGLPVVPSGREAALMAGVLSDHGYSASRATTYYLNVWRFTANAKSARHFERTHQYDEADGRRSQIGPLSADTLEREFERRMAAWHRFVGATMKAGCHTPDEALAFARADLERTLPAKAVDKLDLYVRSVVQYGSDLRARTLVGDQNDAVDLDILFTAVLPAWLVTSDRRLRAIAGRSESADAWRVMSPDELLARLRAEAAEEAT